MVETIAKDIFRGIYAPGDRLPPYRRIAESFGVTLPTAQRAVGRIHELGLVSVRQGSGAAVLDPIVSAHPGVLPYWVAAVIDRPAEASRIVGDFLEVRRELAAVLVAGLGEADTDALARVDERVDQLEHLATSGAPVDEIMKADLDVVRAMLTARGSIALATIFNAFAQLLQSVPALPRAMYASPALNVAGYRGALDLIRSDATPEMIRPVVETTLQELDRVTVSAFEEELSS